MRSSDRILNIAAKSDMFIRQRSERSLRLDGARTGLGWWKTRELIGNIGVRVGTLG
jgi:hypothetical protein